MCIRHCACVRVCAVTGLYWQDAADMHNCADTLKWQEQMDTRVDLLLTIVQTLSSQLAIVQFDTWQYRAHARESVATDRELH